MPSYRKWAAEWSALTVSLGLTGGLENEEPTASLGGYLSKYPVTFQRFVGPTTYTSSEYNFQNIFDSVTTDERTGYVCYRGLYLANYLGGSSYDKTCYGVKLSILQIPKPWWETGNGDVMWFGTDSVGIRTSTTYATMSSISSETVEPTSITWHSSSYTMSLGNLLPGNWTAVWFKHSTTAGTVPRHLVSFSVYISSGVA